MFPVGELRKSDVRRLALERGLAVAEKPDSQEICFVPDGDYASFVDRHLPGDRGGLIVDRTGRVLGRHQGVHHFTVGQRKGLGVATGAALYVVAIDAARRLVTVGARADLEHTAFTVNRVQWVLGQAPGPSARVNVQIRHRHPAAPARVTPADDDRADVVFDTPQAAITPGQAAVFYAGEEVLGGGWIDAVAD
jgi:tRNA-specific 2-thiouridylase